MQSFLCDPSVLEWACPPRSESLQNPQPSCSPRAPDYATEHVTRLHVCAEAERRLPLSLGRGAGGRCCGAREGPGFRLCPSSRPPAISRLVALRRRPSPAGTWKHRHHAAQHPLSLSLDFPSRGLGLRGGGRFFRTILYRKAREAGRQDVEICASL